MTFSKLQIMEIYQRRARRYDLSSRLYKLAGFRIDAYRKRAVEALNLKRGATVVDIGCGTGVNFKALYNAVGAEGHIIGVDASEAMLDQAARRIRREGWQNVKLHHGEAGGWSFPARVDGILSTFALTLIPEYAEVIAGGARALMPGGRFVVLDFRVPESWPVVLKKLWLGITRPFGVTLDLAERRPWMNMHTVLAQVQVRELYLGLAYLADGEVERVGETAASEDASPMPAAVWVNPDERNIRKDETQVIRPC